MFQKFKILDTKSIVHFPFQNFNKSTILTFVKVFDILSCNKELQVFESGMNRKKGAKFT